MKKALFILTSFFCITCFCNELPEHPLSITELVAIALSNHPSTKEMWWNAQKAEAAIGSEKSHFYPTVDAIGEATFDKAQKKNSLEDVNRRHFAARLTLDFLLFDFGKRDAAVAAAKEILLQANWQTDRNVQKILFNVCDASYALLHAQEVCDAVSLSLEEAKKMCEAAEELHRAGLKPITDVYTSRASVARARIEVSERKALLKRNQATLAVNIGMQATIPLTLHPLDTTEVFEKRTTFDAIHASLHSLISLATTKRADVQAKKAELQACVDNVQKEEKAYWPDVSLFSQAEQDRGFSRYKKAAPPSTIQARDKNYSAGIRMTIPLFAGFDSIYTKNQAQATANQTEAELLELQNDISQEVASACFALEAAQEKLPNAKEALENSTKAYESAFERYTIGEGTMVELSEAQEEVFAARIQYSDVKKEWLSAIANVAYATGTSQ